MFNRNGSNYVDKEVRERVATTWLKDKVERH